MVPQMLATFLRPTLPITAGCTDGKLRLVSPKTGEVLRTVDFQGRAILALAFAPGEESLAVGCQNGVLHLVSPETGDVFKTVAFGGGEITSLSHAPGW